MDIFQVLAEPTRRDILEALTVSGQLSATDIYIKFNVSHPAISQHLKVLREAGLVIVTKKAQQRFYQINLTSLSEVEEWIQKIRDRSSLPSRETVGEK